MKRFPALFFAALVVGFLSMICSQSFAGLGQQAYVKASNTGEFDPGIKKTWAYTFQRNEEETVNGRPAGSLMWAGLGNLYFWIDHKNGVGGYWGTQILPFMDVSSYPGFVDFEAAVYRSLK